MAWDCCHWAGQVFFLCNWILARFGKGGVAVTWFVEAIIKAWVGCCQGASQPNQYGAVAVYVRLLLDLSDYNLSKVPFDRICI